LESVLIATLDMKLELNNESITKENKGLFSIVSKDLLGILSEFSFIGSKIPS
jgi:hypothetical protein